MTAKEKTPRPRGLFLWNDWSRCTLAFIVLCICVLPFLPGLTGPFQLDDQVNLESIEIGDGSPAAIYGAVFNNESGLFRRPLSNLTLVANLLVDGHDPYGFKLVNLALHLVNGVVVFFLAIVLIPLLRPNSGREQRYWIALGTAAVWTIHPLQVSTALYVVQRMTQLAAFFMFLAVVVAIRKVIRPTGLPNIGAGVRHTLTVGAIAVIAVLGKENGALVPFLLLALLLSLPAESWRVASDTPGKRAFWHLAVSIPVALTATLVALSWGHIRNSYVGREFTLAERVLTEPVILGGYVKSFFLPDTRTMGLYLDGTPVLGPSDPMAWLGVLVFLSIVVGAWLVRRKIPVASFAVFWFVGSHLLESTVYPLELAFEHRNYVGLFGLSLLLATAISSLFGRFQRGVGLVVAFAVILVLGGITYLRASVWGDQGRFILAEARHHPDSMRAQTGAAVFQSIQGDNNSAIMYVQAAQHAQPDAFFPAAMDIDLACAIPGYPVDWERILDRVRATPNEMDIISVYKALAMKVQGGKCQSDIRERFTAHVDELIDIYYRLGDQHRSQFFLALRAAIETDQEASRSFYRKAVALDPGDRGTLLRYAYFELNAGNAPAAQGAIRTLRAMTPSWHPKSFRVEELERHMDDLRNNPPSSRP